MVQVVGLQSGMLGKGLVAIPALLSQCYMNAAHCASEFSTGLHP